uniref:CARD domain-containing protein n=1 Tax=Mola mola TaxID=94237 RepID=A0A3Q4BFN2_MOLML
DETLRLVRPEFVNRISDSVLKGLLDALLCDRVLNDEETQSLRTKVGADKARDLIDMVRKKGSEASSRLIAAIRNVDPQLSKDPYVRPHLPCSFLPPLRLMSDGF